MNGPFIILTYFLRDILYLIHVFEMFNFTIVFLMNYFGPFPLIFNIIILNELKIYFGKNDIIYKQQRKELMQKSYVAFDIIFEKISKKTQISVLDLKFLYF